MPRAAWTQSEAASLCARARAGADTRSAWTPGPGSTSTAETRSAWGYPSARSCASSAVRPRDDSGRRQPLERRCAISRSPPGFADALLRISCAMRTRSRWPGEGVPLVVIQRQLGHANLGMTVPLYPVGLVIAAGSWRLDRTSAGELLGVAGYGAASLIAARRPDRGRLACLPLARPRTPTSTACRATTTARRCRAGTRRYAPAMTWSSAATSRGRPDNRCDVRALFPC